jgi:hypothetical protein
VKLENPDAERLAAVSEGAEIHWTGLALAAFCFFAAMLWTVGAGAWWYLRNFPNWREEKSASGAIKKGAKIFE